jgi:hypothetical protein
MTSNQFQEMALEIPTAVERSHMNHPDFRVAGKIFASLGMPTKSSAASAQVPELRQADLSLSLRHVREETV